MSQLPPALATRSGQTDDYTGDKVDRARARVGVRVGAKVGVRVGVRVRVRVRVGPAASLDIRSESGGQYELLPHTL